MISHIKTLGYIIIWYLSIPQLYGQQVVTDKVVLLNGDTLAAHIFSDPRREAGLPRRAIGPVFDYGFTQVIAEFPNDSLRIFNPEQLRAYYKAEPGKHLGSGWFISKPLRGNWIGFGRNNNKLYPHFTQRLGPYRDFSIYLLKQAAGSSTEPDYYYFLYLGETEEPDIVRSYSQWKKWAASHPPFDQIAPTLNKPRRKGYTFFIMLQDAGKAYRAMGGSNP